MSDKFCRMKDILILKLARASVSRLIISVMSVVQEPTGMASQLLNFRFVSSSKLTKGELSNLILVNKVRKHISKCGRVVKAPSSRLSVLSGFRCYLGGATLVSSNLTVCK